MLVFGILRAPTLGYETPTATIHAARLLDGRGNTIEDALVTIENGRITRVERMPAGTRPTIELKELTLLPGLIDTHAHLGWYFNRAGRFHGGRDGDTPQDGVVAVEANAHAMLLQGVTTIQSPGAFEDKAVRDRIAAGNLPGPRILTSLQPLQSPNSTPEQFRETVRASKQQGADFIKVFASGSIRDGGALTLSQEQAICSEAKAQGLRVMIHAHGPDSIKAAALAGCTQLEHGIFITEENLKLLAERGIYFDPQVDLVFRNYLENRAKYQGIGNFNDAGFATLERVVPVALRAFQKGIATPGLKVIFGSDAVAGSHGRNVDELDQPGARRRTAAHGGADLGDIAGGGGNRARQGDWHDRFRVRRGPHCRRGRSVERHHRGAARRLRHEGRQGVPRSREECLSHGGDPRREVAGRQRARRWHSLEFTADGNVRVVEVPGSEPAAGRYKLGENGLLTMTGPDGNEQAFRCRIDGQILTREQTDGKRFMFRRGG